MRLSALCGTAAVVAAIMAPSAKADTLVDIGGTNAPEFTSSLSGHGVAPDASGWYGGATSGANPISFSDMNLNFSSTTQFRLTDVAATADFGGIPFVPNYYGWYLSGVVQQDLGGGSWSSVASLAAPDGGRFGNDLPPTAIDLGVVGGPALLGPGDYRVVFTIDGHETNVNTSFDPFTLQIYGVVSTLGSLENLSVNGQAVPEPASLALAGLGIAAAAARGRRSLRR